MLENYAFPGLLLIGTDSHTPNAGTCVLRDSVWCFCVLDDGALPCIHGGTCRRCI